MLDRAVRSTTAARPKDEDKKHNGQTSISTILGAFAFASSLSSGRQYSAK
jgi:hypothetical protein